jgi:preprotein translocase subunit SecE
MRPDTRNPDTPTAKDWAIGFLAVLFIVIIAPALVAAVDWLVHL